MTDGTVSTVTADRLPAVYTAITRISTDVARVRKYVRNRDGDEVVGGLSRLLASRPNEWQTGFEFWRVMVSNMLIYGNACAVIIRNGAGQVEALEPRLPGEVAPTVVDGKIVYNVSNVGTLPQWDVLHFKTRSRDGLWGISPIQQCQDALSLYKDQEVAARSIYQALGSPKMVLTTPKPLTDEAVNRIKGAYKNNNATATGTPLVLREGMEAKTLDAKAADAEFAKARGWSLNDVARIFMIPPTMLQHLEDVRYNSDLGTLNKHYVDACLNLWTAPMQTEIEYKLLRGQDFAFDFTRISGGTFANQIDTLSKAVGSGLLSKEEARERLGLPPLDEEIEEDVPQISQEEVEEDVEEESKEAAA